ncbi:MAG: hypothetical protein JJD92_13535 [Frankiaceae bacterium]|nr:hypothetical protein [Frankiaceae bacterium]
MKSSLRLRSAVGTTIAATALAFVASSVFAAPAAMANPVCAGASVSGDIVTFNVPTRCVDTNLPTLCTAPEAGFSPWIVVHVDACVPI